MYDAFCSLPALAVAKAEVSNGSVEPQAISKRATGRTIYESFNGQRLPGPGVAAVTLTILALFKLNSPYNPIIAYIISSMIEANYDGVYYDINWHEFEVTEGGQFLYWEYNGALRFYTDPGLTHQFDFIQATRQSITQMRIPVEYE